MGIRQGCLKAQTNMSIEIERRFLVQGDAWRALAQPQTLQQGYMKVDKECSIRVRIAGEQAAEVRQEGWASPVEQRLLLETLVLPC